MTLVARGEYLGGRESNASPPGASLPEPLYRLLTAGTVLSGGGHQVCNGFTVPGYRYGFSMLDRPKEFRQAYLGLSSLNFAHVDFNLLF